MTKEKKHGFWETIKHMPVPEEYSKEEIERYDIMDWEEYLRLKKLLVKVLGYRKVRELEENDRN